MFGLTPLLRLAPVLAFMLLLIGCGAVGVSDRTPEPTSTSDADSAKGEEELFEGVEPGADWQRIEARTGLRGLSLLLPPGWEYVQRQGIDSFVGEFTGDGITLRFDYGMYSNQLAMQAGEQDPAYLVRYEQVAGMEAKVVRPVPGGDGYTGIYVPTITPSGIGPFGTSLNIISAKTLTNDERSLVFGILRSVRPI